ncbi:hypothetical protein FH972_024185 [Carpinus fangiana]|uniref:Uncharacterized protein n=1 Tax=Carpinus fangiana TaxID=176857 RepID=A0A5N6KXA9_9ROSI|nr:hypothetical protein FH972_024185 [Carpinus fangiana]
MASMTFTETTNHPQPSVAPSDSGSSSLSELDGTLEEDDEQLSELDSDQASDRASDLGSEEEEDTEAETERLDNSPEKRRRDALLLQSAALRNREAANGGDSGLDNDQESLSGDDLPSIQPLGADTTTARGLPEEEMAGRKRKRTSSLTKGGQTLDVEPARKRSASTRQVSRTLSVRGDLGDIHQVLAESEAHGAEDALSDQSENDDETTVKVNETGVSSPVKGKASDGEDGESSGRELSEPPEDQEQLPDAEQEDGEQVAAEGEVEEEEGADAAAKSEDESKSDIPDASNTAALTSIPVARKMAAMEALKPIENLFAVFRDNQPSPDHPTFIAMRRALDVRRDEKISLEQVSMQYKIGVLERVTTASQAQLHSQFYQSVRQHRETHMSTLNEHFTKIQRDRRQMKSNEPQYGMKFSTKRSQQIANQRSYNKEVSLLSGIARHVGFPAAPDIRAPNQIEIDDDLRAMKIRAPPSHFTTQPQLPGGRARQDEGVADESWVERNAWANPNHPVNQQARFMDRQAMASSTPYATPAIQRRAMDVRNAPGTGSTLELGSEHRSSVQGPGPNSEALVYEKSSPFEQMKRRNIETHRPDGTPRAQYAELTNGTKTAQDGPPTLAFDAPAAQGAYRNSALHQEASSKPYAPRPDTLDMSPENQRQRSLGYPSASSPTSVPAAGGAGLGVR